MFEVMEIIIKIRSKKLYIMIDKGIYDKCEEYQLIQF